MFKNKFITSNELAPPTLISASIFLSSTITIFIYMFLPFFIDLDQIVQRAFFYTFLFMFASLLSIIFILLGALINEINKGKAYVTELKNFKDFTDDLHHVSTEVEVYELLFDFIRRIPQISQATIFYRSDFSSVEAAWTKITDEVIPLCNMSAKKCPVIQFGKINLVLNIKDSVQCSYQCKEFKYGGYVCLPVINSGFRQCIIQTYSDSAYFFDNVTVSKIKSYIEIARVVIHSGRTVHMLNVKASTDKLTKLYNRGYLEAFLDSQIESSKQTRKQLSLIVGDIDHFKQINDTYGHDAGDYILTHFATYLLKCTRKSDLVSRFGGDEFVIALPDTDTETANQIAERIVHTVRTSIIPPFNGREIHKITCSLGVSTFPMFCNNRETLFKTADIALYKSKQSGRNAASIYSPV